jgi:hypothetical protein
LGISRGKEVNSIASFHGSKLVIKAQEKKGAFSRNSSEFWMFYPIGGKSRISWKWSKYRKSSICAIKAQGLEVG